MLQIEKSDKVNLHMGKSFVISYVAYKGVGHCIVLLHILHIGKSYRYK